MTEQPTVEDIAALRAQGDLHAYFLGLLGPTPTKPAPAPRAELQEPTYHIPRKGAWPCGTAASGPTPAPCDGCTEGTP
jgi:hypothetical protein